MADKNLLDIVEVFDVQQSDYFYSVRGATDQRQKLDTLRKGVRATLSGTSIDWNSATDFVKTLTQNEIFTDANLPTGSNTKVITLSFTGDFSITFPAYWSNYGGEYDGTVNNLIVVFCLNGTGGSEDIRYIIHNEE